MLLRSLAGVVAAAAVAACGPPVQQETLLFIDGRAAAPLGDTLLAFTRPGLEGFLVRRGGTGAVDTLGRGQLTSPLHVEHQGGRWYVSDVAAGRRAIAVFDATGAPVRRIELPARVRAPHQFAVLPDGRIVVEAADGELVALGPDAETTFTVSDRADRPGLLLGARGGVLHAVPGKFVTLFNANGNVRWRLPWPWHQRAYVTDLAEDARGRLHLLAGEEDSDEFVVFSLSPVTGEVVRWSVPGPFATFVIERLGGVRPDSAARWVG